MMFACALLAAAILGEGTCGAYSPDGGKIAMQRTIDGKSRVGVLDRASGRFAWLEKKGNAAFPAWSPSGDAIVYTYGNETNTAWTAKGGDTGYHLRIWRRGEGVREITTGRFRDYMPSFSRDGEKVFFASTRCASPEVLLATRSGIYSANVDGSGLACLVPSQVNDEGSGQPVISPDGRMLALAQISGFRSTWRIVCARLSDPERLCTVSPKGQSAYAPRWTPDGRHIVYTGFAKGDPGWCVYVLDPRTGATKRICEGRNPDVHPSGTFLLYDDGMRLYERQFGAADLPSTDAAVDEESRIFDEPEKLFWRTENPRYPATVQMSDAFRFGADCTFFVRAKVRYAPKSDSRFQHYITGEYVGAKLGFELFADNGRPKFGARDGAGAYMGAISDMVLEPGREYTLTGIRTCSSLFIHVEGASRQEMRFSATYPLDQPIRLEIGTTVAGSDCILAGEIGTGWPSNVAHPMTRTKFFAEEGAK